MELAKSEYKKISKLCGFGERFAEKGEFAKAIEEYQKALEILPHPIKQWEASTWIYSAIGDAYFFLGDFQKAKETFYDAMNCPDGMSNPFILLRLGQSIYECNNFEKAREYLLRAYMLEGVSIFEDEDKKFYKVIENITEEEAESYASAVKQVNAEVDERIDNLIHQSDDEYDKGNYIESINLLEKAWEVLSEPKGLHDESYHIAKDISEICLLIKDISKAKKWSEILFSCDLERIDGGEREFVAGKIAFAENELNRAREYFAIANEKSRSRCFEDEDSKYLKFFKGNIV